MNNKPNIGIIGCGWLGLPLGRYLYNRGFKVYGTTTSEEKLPLLKKNHIKASVLKLNKDGQEGDLKDLMTCEIIIINIPPMRKSPEVVHYENKILSLLENLKDSKVKHILFVSSTSVYGQEQKELSEAVRPKPITESGKQLLRVEDILFNHLEWQNSIVRFGGLMGYDRIPGRFLSGKKDLPKGGSPVNLVHRDDCIECIYQIIENEKWCSIYNFCCPEHPSKKDFYTQATNAINLPPPEFKDMETTGKSISSKKLIKELNFKFKYNNPLDCIF